MELKENNRRPETSTLDYPMISLLEVERKMDGDTQVSIGYHTSVDLLKLLMGADIELKPVEVNEKVSSDKVLPKFTLLHKGTDIGAGFKNTGQGKYEYKVKLRVKEDRHLLNLPDGLKSFVEYQKEGEYNGKPFAKGLSLFFYPHHKTPNAHSVKIQKDDYIALCNPPAETPFGPTPTLSETEEGKPFDDDIPF